MPVTLFVLSAPVPLCNQNYDTGIVVAAQTRCKDFNKQDCPVPLDVTAQKQFGSRKCCFFCLARRQANLNALKVGLVTGIVVMIFVQNSGGIDWQSRHVFFSIFFLKDAVCTVTCRCFCC